MSAVLSSKVSVLQSDLTKSLSFLLSSPLSE